jgi:hypothetical protein
MRTQHEVTAETQEAAKLLTGEAQAVGTILTITAPKSVDGRSCECGCGGKTSGGWWVPGHDAKRKSLLFAEYRSGDARRKATAEAEMIRRDWPLPNAKADRKPTATA